VISVKRFSAFIEASGHESKHALPPSLFTSYFDLLIDAQPHLKTLRSYTQQQIWAIGIWVSFLKETGRLTTCTFKPITRVRAHKGHIRLLSEKDMELLFSLCQTHEEALLILLAHGCGLRRSEIVKLKVRHIHLDQRVISVIDGKGSQHRIVPICEKLWISLLKAINGRRLDPEDFVFCKGQWPKRMRSQIIETPKGTLSKR